MDEKFAALKKYNFWDGNIPALGYLRKHYTDKIADYVGNKLLTAFLESKMPTRLYGCNLFTALTQQHLPVTLYHHYPPSEYF